MRCFPAGALPFIFAALLPQGMAAGISGATPQQLEQTQQTQRRQQAAQAASWYHCLQEAIAEIHRRGAGGYSTADAAHDALHAAFAWNERSQRLSFNPAGARPSFCSGAVYAALLSALIRWDAAQPQRRLSPAAWQALAPQRVPDGVGAWGWANANGPGFAALVHRLGAGHSFTAWEEARPADVVKIWWNDAIGAAERGHLAILVQDKGESVRIWSSNQRAAAAAGGFGFREYPKSAIRRVLFTRITKPEAFNRAPSIKENAWLMQLTERNVSWQESLRHSGVPR